MNVRTLDVDRLEPGESREAALNDFRDLCLEALATQQNFDPMFYYTLSSLPFTPRQSKDMGQALIRHADRLDLRSSESLARAITAVKQTFDRNAGIFVEPSELPPRAMPEQLKSDERNSADQAKFSTVKVDHAWVAPSVGDAKFGHILYAAAQGNRMLLTVENVDEVTRQTGRSIVALTLPSLEQRTLVRLPDLPSPPGPQGGGPLLAADADRICFWWDGALNVISGSETRKLEGPELNDPRLWMVQQSLYANDSRGILVCWDLASGKYDVPGSRLRRPSQFNLDSEASLGSIYRIFAGPDHQTGLMLGWQLFTSQPDGAWKVTNPLHDMTLPWRRALLEKAWDWNGRQFNSELGRLIGVTSKFATSDVRVLSALMEKLDSGSGNRTMRFDAFLMEGTTLWALCSDFRSDDLFLLRLEVEKKEFAMKKLDFSPEFLSALDKGEQSSSRPFWNLIRLVPSEEGIALYSPENPILWFIQKDELPMVSYKYE